MRLYGKIYENDSYVSIDTLYGHEVIALLDDITTIVNTYNPDTQKLGHTKLRSCHISPSSHTDYLVVELEGTFPFPLFTLISLPGNWAVEFLPCNSPDKT
jgi:hypothetical protein